LQIESISIKKEIIFGKLFLPDKRNFGFWILNEWVVLVQMEINRNKLDGLVKHGK
jgi:hypothetical protein